MTKSWTRMSASDLLPLLGGGAAVASISAFIKGLMIIREQKQSEIKDARARADAIAEDLKRQTRALMETRAELLEFKKNAQNFKNKLQTELPVPLPEPSPQPIKIIDGQVHIWVEDIPDWRARMERNEHQVWPDMSLMWYNHTQHCVTCYPHSQTEDSEHGR